MVLGQKHSLCLISIVSNAQPSESMPTKNSPVGFSSANGRADSGKVDMNTSQNDRL